VSPVTKTETEERRLMAAGLLADGKPVKEIAAELQVSRVQIWRWMQRPEVAAHFLVAINSKAASLVGSAIDCLSDLIQDPNTPQAVKVAACKVLFDRADKLEMIRDRVIDVRPEQDNPARLVPANPWEFLSEKKGA
jgi:transposase-like protein